MSCQLVLISKNRTLELYNGEENRTKVLHKLLKS